MSSLKVIQGIGVESDQEEPLMENETSEQFKVKWDMREIFQKLKDSNSINVVWYILEEGRRVSSLIVNMT